MRYGLLKLLIMVTVRSSMKASWLCESCVYARVCDPLMDRCIVDWMDNSLDILSFIENYIPDGPYIIKTTPLPMLLQCVSPAVAAEQGTHGLKDRNMVGIGHSLGGGSM